MLSQQDQEMRRNVPDPLFAGGIHFCGSGVGDETSAFFVTVSCVICGYHVYKEVWNPSIGEAFVFIKHWRRN